MLGSDVLFSVGRRETLQYWNVLGKRLSTEQARLLLGKQANLAVESAYAEQCILFKVDSTVILP